MLIERLFLAVDLPPGTRVALLRHLESTVPAGLPGKPVPPDNWHLTLRFLGETAGSRRERLIGQLNAVFWPDRFAARLNAAGAFPRPSRASVLWIGVHPGEDRLAALARICENAARESGYAPEEKRFTPHLTIARLRAPQDLAPLVQRLGSADVPLEVGAVTLFRSQPGSGPPRYEPVAAWPLR